jgi:hypothetical protein
MAECHVTDSMRLQNAAGGREIGMNLVDGMLAGVSRPSIL